MLSQYGMYQKHKSKVTRVGSRPRGCLARTGESMRAMIVILKRAASHAFACMYTGAHREYVHLMKITNPNAVRCRITLKYEGGIAAYLLGTLQPAHWGMNESQVSLEAKR